MLRQRILAWFDEVISSLFNMSSLGSGNDQGGHIWTYFFDIGPRIGIVGNDSKIHTVTGYFSVQHYYNGDKLLKRIPVRKDLASGERLATSEEIRQHQKELSLRSHSGGMEN
ncbi:MAG TPA: hypothetical protein VJK04_02925 [Candidatus Paceibacterota bacterium]